MISIVIAYLVVTWFIGAIFAIRVVKTGTFPTKEIAEYILSEDLGFILFLCMLSPVLLLLAACFAIPYYTHYLIFEKEWRKK